MTAVFSRRSALGVGAVALGTGLVAGGRSAASATTAEGSGADAASAAIVTPSGTGAAASASVDPARPTRSLFAGHEGREYRGASPWAEHSLMLEYVGDLPGGGDGEHRFSASFLTDDGARDGIYRILHEGELVASLFLARAGGGERLQAIVDRGVEA